MATLTKRWTYEDYLKLEDDKRYEIIEGELIEMPTPSTAHQKEVKKLLRLMDDFVEEKKIDVIFSEENVVQPNLLFVSTKDKKKLYTEFGVRELWLIFPGGEAVEIFSLEKEGYKVCSFGYEKGEVRSCILKNFKVDLEKLFKEVR